MRQLDPREVLRERADRRADRHLVVVEDDEQSRLTMADVIERLEAEAAHERRVADHDRDPLLTGSEIPRGGETLGDREPRSGMATVEHVVLRLGSTREAADARELAQRA